LDGYENDHVSARCAGHAELGPVDPTRIFLHVLGAQLPKQLHVRLRLFLLSFLILALASTTAFAQSVGSSCSGTNKGKIYGNGGGFLLSCDGTTWTALLNAGGNGSPGGSTGYVQFNSSNALAGDSSLFWDNTNKYLGIGTATPAVPMGVYGTDAALTLTSAAGRSFKFESSDTNSVVRLGTFSNHNLIVLTNNTTRIVLLNSGNIGISTTSPASSLDLSQKTDALALPSGTSGQQPGSPVAGMIRYNSTISKVEYYNGSAWLPL
jgi:hypothetical protein